MRVYHACKTLWNRELNAGEAISDPALEMMVMHSLARAQWSQPCMRGQGEAPPAIPARTAAAGCVAQTGHVGACMVGCAR